MMQGATICLAIFVWGSAACRVGHMDRRHHSIAVMLWHVGVGWAALLAAASTWVEPDPLAFGLVAALAVYSLLTLDEWEFGPPAWAHKGNR